MTQENIARNKPTKIVAKKSKQRSPLKVSRQQPHVLKKPCGESFAPSESCLVPSKKHETKAVLPSEEFKVFCDLDGVLAGFRDGMKRVSGKYPEDQQKEEMWSHAQQADSFFFNLDWQKGGEELWNGIRHLNPTILTGVPNLENACRDKYRWCCKKLRMPNYTHTNMAGYEFRHSQVNATCRKRDPKKVTNVITCWSFNKHYESGQYHVLIDDSIHLKADWEKAGGIFVHHTSTPSTLLKLKELGVIA